MVLFVLYTSEGKSPFQLDPSSLCGSVDVNCQQNNNNINYRRPQLLAFEGVESPRVRTSNGLNSIVPEEENTEMCNSHRLRTIIKEVEWGKGGGVWVVNFFYIAGLTL